VAAEVGHGEQGPAVVLVGGDEGALEERVIGGGERVGLAAIRQLSAQAVRRICLSGWLT
jgi:hypothetical protein